MHSCPFQNGRPPHNHRSPNDHPYRLPNPPPPPTPPPPAPLSRTLRQRDLFLLFIGSVIGSGVFLTPGLILRQLDGSVGYAFLVWIIGGILSPFGALTHADVA